MRFAIGLAAALGLSACTTMMPAEAPGELRVATWNLEFLAEHDGAGCQPRGPADYALLASYAKTLDADVVGFQEVENEAAAHRVFPADAYDVVMSGQPYPATQDHCGQNSAQAFIPQRTGFAIRKGIAYIVNPPLQALNVSDNPDRPVRWGVDITLTGKTPLRLLDVHLKSGCSGGADPKNKACPELFKQEPVVESWIDAREAEGTAFLLLGDFNRHLGEADAQVWDQWNDSEPAGLKLTTAANAAAGGPIKPRCEGGKYPAFIDHVVFNERSLLMFDPGSFSELVYAEQGKAAPSDHCPISVLLKR